MVVIHFLEGISCYCIKADSATHICFKALMENKVTI